MGTSGIGNLPRWLIAFTAVCLFLMHLPVLVLIAFSFNALKFAVTWTGFTLGWYRRLLERDDILHALQASLIVGITATAIAVTLGTLIALALARHRFRGRTIYEGMMYVPIVTPEIVTGISLLVLFVFLRIPLGLATIDHRARGVLRAVRRRGRGGPVGWHGPESRGSRDDPRRR